MNLFLFWCYSHACKHRRSKRTVFTNFSLHQAFVNTWQLLHMYRVMKWLSLKFPESWKSGLICERRRRREGRLGLGQPACALAPSVLQLQDQDRLSCSALPSLLGSSLATRDVCQSEARGGKKMLWRKNLSDSRVGRRAGHEGNNHVAFAREPPQSVSGYFEWHRNHGK